MESKASTDLLGFFTSFMTNDGIWVKARKREEEQWSPTDLLLVNLRMDIICEIIMFLFCLLEVSIEQQRLFILY